MTGFERPRYFVGKVLTAEDLELEQRYHIEKRWLLNRELRGPGVVSGLEVRPGDGFVTVEPGFALDSNGREILVAEPRQVAIPDCGEPVFVCLLYAEVETDRESTVETYDLMVSTFPVPAQAVVLSVVDDVNLIDSDGA
jgi:hypothetical protein